jgi:NAD(P)-dependent dehydrogenase (short-subunit alcohol dehydrogenase family)
VGATGYSASKAALDMLTINSLRHLVAEGIKVNAADPGYTATDLNGHTGTRTVEEAAAIAVELATLGPHGCLRTVASPARPRSRAPFSR